MGLDATTGYDIGNIKPNMPNLQNIMNSESYLIMFGLTQRVHQQEQVF